MQARFSLTLIVLLFGGSLFAQSAPPSAVDRQWLAGTWKLDRSGPPEDEKNWNRVPTNRTTSPDNRTAGSWGPQESGKIYSIAAFGQTLLAPSETLVLQVELDAIAIRDDYREPTRFETNGRSRTMEVLPRSASGTARGAVLSSPRSMTVSARSSWNGSALVQEVWTRETSEIVRITRTFIPYDEGRKMLLVIKVLEPKLKDPVKDIERVYVRSSQ